MGLEHVVAGAGDRVRIGDVNPDGLESVRLRAPTSDDDGAAGSRESLRKAAPNSCGAADDEDGAVADLHYGLLVALGDVRGCLNSGCLGRANPGRSLLIRGVAGPPFRGERRTFPSERATSVS